MKTIKETVINEIIINKSRFICVLCNINNSDEVKDKIDYYKKIYKDATHYCFAYIIDSYMKSSDDGEPSGTAGMPILNVLKNNNLNHVLCIVIRYFGGIKLGAGGLVRAYGKSVTEALNNGEIADLKNGYYLEISFDYDNIKFVDNVLKNIDVKKNFDEKIVYSFKIAEDLENITNLLKDKVDIIKKEPILLAV